MQHEVVKWGRMLPMPRRQIARTVPSASTTAWYGTPRAWTVILCPTLEGLAGKTLFRPKEGNHARKAPMLTSPGRASPPGVEEHCKGN